MAVRGRAEVSFARSAKRRDPRRSNQNPEGGKSQGMEEKLGLLVETGGGAGTSGQRGLRGRMGSID